MEEWQKLNVLLQESQQTEVYEKFSVYIDLTQPHCCFISRSEKKTKK